MCLTDWGQGGGIERGIRRCPDVRAGKQARKKDGEFIVSFARAVLNIRTKYEDGKKTQSSSMTSLPDFGGRESRTIRTKVH